ncbi:MAG: efflux RND transporter permease subunit, partial [Saprospiraceae bacterium]
GKVGSSEIPTDPMPVEACDLIVILKERAEWTSAKTRDELAEKMTEALEDVPGVTFSFQQPIQMRFNELMTGARQDVVVKIYGEDLDALTDYAKKVGKIAGSIPGAADLYIEQATGQSQIVVKYDRDRIAQFGLNIDDINQVIRTGFAGESAGLVFEGEKRFDLVVRLAGENRQSLDDLKNLSVTAPNGLPIPLDQVAEVSFQNSPSQIQRDDAQRRITVGFNVRGRDVESIVQELQGRIGREIKFAPGYYPTYGGTFENLVEARARLAIAVPVALALIFFLLFFAFHSLKQGLLIFTAIPLSAIGGVFALWLRSMPFSISAGVGFIALFGVAVLNGIVLISEFKRLEREEGLTDLHDIVLRGTFTRLRPVLLTATVASLGFLPMALSHGSGAEVQKPLATVVIGGLVSATFLTLLVLPVLFVYFEKLKTKRSKISAPTVTLLLLAGCFFPKNAMAQTPVSETQAIEMALQNNRSIVAGQYEIDRQRILKKSAVDIPKTDLNASFGQINSVQRDNNFSIGQSIPFPTVFQKQKQLAEANVAGSVAKLAITRNELVANVRSVYNDGVFLLSRRQLLLRQDSLLGAFAKAADLRYRTGESTYLEKVNAESQLAQVRNLRAQNDLEVGIVGSQLQTLLQASEAPGISDSLLRRRDFAFLAETNATAANPQLTYLRQQIDLANRQTAVEKARRLPDLRLGYFNQSII